MKFRHTIALGAALLLLPTGCSEKKVVAPTETQSRGKVEWLTDFEAAQAQARAQNRMLLMNFTGSDWCPPCMALEKAVFSKPEFADYATKHLVLLEVDFPRRKPLSAEQRAANEKLAAKFGVDGFPTIGILKPNGEPIGALGYSPGTTAPAFIAALEKFRTSGQAERP